MKSIKAVIYYSVIIQNTSRLCIYKDLRHRNDDINTVQ